MVMVNGSDLLCRILTPITITHHGISKSGEAKNTFLKSDVRKRSAQAR
jgi:hypothetical protein